MAREFDESADKVIIPARKVIESGSTWIEMSIRAYNGGEPKVQLSRYRFDRDNDDTGQPIKLGRVSIPEMLAITEEFRTIHSTLLNTKKNKRGGIVIKKHAVRK